MDYFSPETFLKFGRLRRDRWRLGQFTIEPVNNQYNNEFYWITSSVQDDGKFQTSYYQSAPLRESLKPATVSPKFKTEELAIRWLEKELAKLAQKKIAAKNKELLALVEENKEFIPQLRKDKCRRS